MRKQLFEVRPSKIQGLGAFAIAPIPAGTRIIEYTGERISTAEADRRYADDASEHPHVLLFNVDSRTVIDAAVRGNEARFINHSCEPNCETVVEKKRVFVEAIRDIEPGEELLYDYNLTRHDDDPPGYEEKYACHCGAPTCRGTMLVPLESQKKGKRRAGSRANKVES